MFSVIRKVVVGVEGLMKISLVGVSDVPSLSNHNLTMQCMS